MKSKNASAFVFFLLLFFPFFFGLKFQRTSSSLYGFYIHCFSKQMTIQDYTFANQNSREKYSRGVYTSDTNYVPYIIRRYYIPAAKVFTSKFTLSLSLYSQICLRSHVNSIWLDSDIFILVIRRRPSSFFFRYFVEPKSSQRGRTKAIFWVEGEKFKTANWKVQNYRLK